MDIQVISEDNCPFLQIDNFFDESEQANIWRELDYYDAGKCWNNDPRDPTRAREEDGTVLARNSRIYLDNIYRASHRLFSPVLTHHMKIYSAPVINAYKDMCPASRTVVKVNQDKTFLSYYGHDDEYKFHTDGNDHSVLIYFHKEPKAFEGGDLMFEDSGVTVECKHNRMVMFPSFYLHASSRLIMSATNEIGAGKYTISSFLWKKAPKPLGAWEEKGTSSWPPSTSSQRVSKDGTPQQVGMGPLL